jgi:SAM-dependent methyltransferase
VRDVEVVRAYYAKILPFYEKETVANAHPAFWRGLARRWRPARILEIGSGLGQVSAALSREAPTFGIDVSLDMLLRARRRRGGSGARFVAADARETVFGCSFDLIVAPSDPFCHLTKVRDRRRALGGVARQLAPEGRFVLDALYRPGRKALTLGRRVRYSGGALRIDETWRPDRGRDLWRATYRFSDFRPGKRSRTLEASFLARAWDPRELEPLFEACGLAVEKVWGDFGRHRFLTGSRRLIVVARRRARFLHGER